MTMPSDCMDGPHADVAAMHRVHKHGHKRDSVGSASSPFVDPAKGSQNSVVQPTGQGCNALAVGDQPTEAVEGHIPWPEMGQTSCSPSFGKAWQDASGASKHDPVGSDVEQGCIHSGHAHKTAGPESTSIVESSAKFWRDFPGDGTTGQWHESTVCHKVDSAESTSFSFAGW